MGEQKAAQPPLGRLHAQTLYRREADPLLPVIDQDLHVVGIFHRRLAIKLNLQPEHFQMGGLIQEHRDPCQALGLCYLPALVHGLELDPVQIADAHAGERIARRACCDVGPCRRGLRSRWFIAHCCVRLPRWPVNDRLSAA